MAQLGKRIKSLLHARQFLSAKDRYEDIKNIEDELARLRQRRDFYDEKYETRRFEEMVRMEDTDEQHQAMLKKML